MNKTLILFLIILYHLPSYAQHTFSGKVIISEKEPLDIAQIVLSVNDSIIGASYTSQKGEFTFNNLSSDNYLVQIRMLGYKPFEQICDIDKNTNLTFTLTISEINLKEVVVSANMSERVKRTATGQIFYLSEKAKSRGSAFRALQEIPKLISNDGTQSVTMNDGTAPLILIDGIAINSGVAPIDPKEIESVEVMDVVSARYLKKGVKNIVNIKLKQKADPYLFFQTATRHDIPLRNGFGVVYFEVGNPKFSLYGRGAYNYTHNDDTKLSEWQQGDNYYKEAFKKNRKNGGKYIGELLFKWRPGENDFLIAHVYGTADDKKQKTWGAGNYTTTQTKDFDYDAHGKVNSYIFTGSLYHKHIFAPKKNLETTLAYNRNRDKNRNILLESYTDGSYDNFYNYKSDRWSGSLDISYSWEWNANSLNFGSSTDYLNDDVDKISENNPVFHHRKWNQYFYTDFSSKIGNFLYFASLGVEGIWTKAGGISNNYIKPRASASGTYEINENNSFQLGYTLSNESPVIGQLNPYNTSVDSLVKIQGNPKLLPTQNHMIQGSYTFNKYGLYLTPNIAYNIFTDKVESYGYSDRGIYIHTFKNMGRFKRLSAGGTASYRFQYGRVYTSASHNIDYFTGQSAKKYFQWGAGLTLNYKKWSFVSDFEGVNYLYTATSLTKRVTPFVHLQLIYNIKDNMYVSTALSGAIGRSRTKAYTYGDQYNDFNQQSKTYYPWVLFRYTFRKNQKKKIDVGNVVRSKESGIVL